MRPAFSLVVLHVSQDTALKREHRVRTKPVIEGGPTHNHGKLWKATDVKPKVAKAKKARNITESVEPQFGENDLRSSPSSSVEGGSSSSYCTV